MNDQKTLQFVESRIQELSEHLKSITKELSSLTDFLMAIKNDVSPNAEIINTEPVIHPQIISNPTTNVPVTPKQPVFRGQTSDVHPIDFMCELEEFITAFAATSEQQINLAISCLQGEARTLVRAFRYKINTFADFNELFLEHFWGIERQRKVRLKLENGAYEAKKGVSHMADYFLRWLAMIQTLRVVPSTPVFLAEISRHYPVAVQSSLRLLGDGTVETALLVLKQEDELLNDSKPRVKKRRRDQHECWRRSPRMQPPDSFNIASS
jgi:sulfite reductase alpha subunit-like flavoprotein